MYILNSEIQIEDIKFNIILYKNYELIFYPSNSKFIISDPYCDFMNSPIEYSTTQIYNFKYPIKIIFTMIQRITICVWI